MSKSSRFGAALLAVCQLTISSARPAAPQDVTAADPSSLLRELDAAEKQRQSSSSARRNKAYATLATAAAGGSEASHLYEDAVKNTVSEEKQGKGKKNGDPKSVDADVLRSDQLQAAVAFQARYLLIGLHLQESGQEEKAADASFAYARDYVQQFSAEKFVRLPEPANGLLQKPAAEGPLCKWLFLGGDLPPGESWEPAAGNLDGILEKNVRPVWRKTGDPRLASTWDLEIEFQEKRAEAHGSDFDRKKFGTIVKPRLLFLRASDRLLQGQPNWAAKEILGLAKSYPSHPDWPEWAAKLRSILHDTAHTGAQGTAEQH